MKVSLIGTGLMGFAMAERLLERGHELTVWNRTRAKAEPLGRRGAALAGSAAAALAASPATLLMLADGPAIRAALAQGAAAAADAPAAPGAAGVSAAPAAPSGRLPDLAGRTVVQAGTIGSAASLALQRDVLAAGGDYFEAPVLGSTPQARQGRLHVLVGASRAQFDAWGELLGDLGRPHLVGAVGEAATFKLAYNQLIAALLAAFSVSLGLVRRKGLDVEVFMAVLRETAFYAPTFDAKLPRLCARDFAEPNFPTRHLLKDVELVLAEAGAAGLETATVDAVRAVVAQALAMGLGDADYSAIYQAIDPG
jgi:3-hydroxyisobutyrate dehydrogenase